MKNKTKVWKTGNTEIMCTRKLSGWRVDINGHKHAVLKDPSYLERVKPQKDYVITTEDGCFTLALRGNTIALVKDGVCTESGIPWVPVQPLPRYVRILNTSMFFGVLAYFIIFIFMSDLSLGALDGALVGVVIIGLIHPARLWLEKCAGRDIAEPAKTLRCVAIAAGGALFAILVIHLILQIVL